MLKTIELILVEIRDILKNKAVVVADELQNERFIKHNNGTVRHELELLFDRGYILQGTTAKPLSENDELRQKAIYDALASFRSLILGEIEKLPYWDFKDKKVIDEADLTKMVDSICK